MTHCLYILQFASESFRLLEPFCAKATGGEVYNRVLLMRMVTVGGTCLPITKVPVTSIPPTFEHVNTQILAGADDYEKVWRLSKHYSFPL